MTAHPTPPGTDGDRIARLRATVEALCTEVCLPRLPGSPRGRRARALLEAAFGDLGLEPVGAAGYAHAIPGIGGANLVGVLSGGPGARLVVLGAHYDACVIDGGVNPGADDNAAGVAAVLEVARAVASRLGQANRRVVVVAFDAEEPPYFQGPTMGSRRLVAHPPFPLEAVDLMVNLDVVGHRIGGDAAPPEVGDALLAVGTERSPEVAALLAGTGPVDGLAVHRLSSRLVGPMSDHAAFEEAGIPVLAYGLLPDDRYHASTDTPDRVDYVRVAAVVDHVTDLVLRAAHAPPAPFRHDAEGTDDPADVATLRVLSRLLADHPRFGGRVEPLLDAAADRAAGPGLTPGDQTLLRRIFVAVESVATTIDGWGGRKSASAC